MRPEFCHFRPYVLRGKHMQRGRSRRRPRCYMMDRSRPKIAFLCACYRRLGPRSCLDIASQANCDRHRLTRKRFFDSHVEDDLLPQECGKRT